MKLAQKVAAQAFLEMGILQRIDDKVSLTSSGEKIYNAARAILNN
jgi:hypothetical protein